jgi:protein-tyrosine kinase
MRSSEINREQITSLYRLLKNNLLFSNTGKEVKSIMITSGNKGSGKTTISRNLALTMAKSGLKTLLIDSSLNSTYINTILQLSEQNELITVSSRGNQSNEIVKKSNIDKLDFLFCRDLTEKYSTERAFCEHFKILMAYLSLEYNFIIMDAPSIIESSFVQLAAQSMDGCILVIDSGKEKIKSVRKAKELLVNCNAKLLGTILNKADENIFPREPAEYKRNIGG